MKLDKTGISSKSELLDRMQYYEAGETVAVTVKRAGSDGYEEKVIDVELGRKADLPGYKDTEQEEQKQESPEDESEEEYYNNGDNGQDWYDFGESQQPFFDNGDGLGDLFRYFGF